VTCSKENPASPAQQESLALTVARAHVEAWAGQDWDTARSMLAPDVQDHRNDHGPISAATHLAGADEYMKGLIPFADPIVLGSVRELADEGDDRDALLTLDLGAAGGPYKVPVAGRLDRTEAACP
jgi:hypothetical protein